MEGGGEPKFSSNSYAYRLSRSAEDVIIGVAEKRGRYSDYVQEPLYKGWTIYFWYGLSDSLKVNYDG